MRVRSALACLSVLSLLVLLAQHRVSTLSRSSTRLYTSTSTSQTCWNTVLQQLPNTQHICSITLSPPHSTLRAITITLLNTSTITITQQHAKAFDTQFLANKILQAYPLDCALFSVTLQQPPQTQTLEQHSKVAHIAAAGSIAALFKRWEALWNRALYCQQFNCALLMFIGWDGLEQHKKGGYFYRAIAAKLALQHYPYVFYADSDAFFSKKAFEEKLLVEQYIPQNMLLNEDNEGSNGPIEIVLGNWALDWLNSGLLIMRRSDFVDEFLCKWWGYATTPHFQNIHDQVALWHLMFVYLDQHSKNSTGIPPYANELEKECQRYGKCIVAFKKRWRKVFGTSRITPGAYPFFFVHERFHHETKTAEELYATKFWKDSEDNSYKAFHCVSCDQSTDDSFIIHTGTASWNRLKHKAAEAFDLFDLK
jgi:hypothetical protein